MTSMTHPAEAPARPGTATRTGLVLAALLGLADLSGPFVVPQPAAGENGPPMAVLVVGAVLGVVTLLAVAQTWRTGSRVGARVAAGARIISALTALPAFFAPDVPPALRILAAASVLLTAVVVYLLLRRPAA